MKKVLNLPLAFAAVLLSGIPVHAATSARQTVIFSVIAINEFSVRGNPGSMTVSTGSLPV
jgi:hypothetical protein